MPKLEILTPEGRKRALEMVERFWPDSHPLGNAYSACLTSVSKASLHNDRFRLAALVRELQAEVQELKRIRPREAGDRG